MKTSEKLKIYQTVLIENKASELVIITAFISQQRVRLTQIINAKTESYLKDKVLIVDHYQYENLGAAIILCTIEDEGSWLWPVFETQLKSVY